MDQNAPETELSRPLDLRELPPQGLSISVEATPAERAALCRRFGLEDLPALAAQIRVERARRGDCARAIRVRASFSARVAQLCVVTLESFPVNVADEFEIYFVSTTELAADEDAVADIMSEDSLELLSEPEIDLGELVAQHLALALDPHPRRPGITAQIGGAAANNPDLAAPADNPFAILGQLKHKM